MGSFEEAVAAFSVGSWVRGCWGDYWVSLAGAAVWLVYAAWSRAWRKADDDVRVRDRVRASQASAPLVILCLWGLESTVAQAEYFVLLSYTGAPTWHSGYFIHWLNLSHSLLALCLNAGALLMAHLLRWGGRFEASVLAVASSSTVVLTVIVDWLFGLFVTTPFQPPVP